MQKIFTGRCYEWGFVVALNGHLMAATQVKKNLTGNDYYLAAILPTGQRMENLTANNSWHLVGPFLLLLLPMAATVATKEITIKYK